MKKSSDPLKDFHRLLAKKDFKSESELKKFMNSIMMKPIQEIP